jgi:hypothetical protein
MDQVLRAPENENNRLQLKAKRISVKLDRQNFLPSAMPRQRKIVSAAWEYFLAVIFQFFAFKSHFQQVDGGAQCQIDGCTHKFLKRASGSSTKFLWSHLESHHRELSKELGRQGKKRKRIVSFY